jgi:hypothetical protein
MSWVDPAEGVSTGAPPMTAGRRVVSGLALLMEIGSILMGFLFLGNFAFGVIYFTWMWSPGQGPSWRTLLFQLSGPWWITFLLCWVGMAWGLGYSGFRLARARLEPDRRASIASTAARFSSWGHVGVGLDLALIAGLLVYRWTH